MVDRRSKNTVPPPEWGSFEDALRGEHAALHAFAARLLGGADEADDLLQDVYLEAYRAWRRAPHRAVFDPRRLYRLVYWRGHDAIRTRARRFPQAGVGIDLDVRDPRPGPEVAVAQRTTAQQALNALPHDSRAVLVLVDALGFSYREAADTLGVRVGTIASRLSVARERFRSALAKGGEEEI